MAGGNIRVTPEQLDSIAAQLNGGASNIESLLQTLANQVSPLGSDWAGNAQASFENDWNQWHKGAQQLHQGLTGMAQIMQKTAEGFRSADSVKFS
jgi:early secretory antigenic target protein ESAT-6